MTKLLYIAAGLFYFTFSSFNMYAGQNDVLGTWFNEEKDAKIKLYKKNGKLYGKIVWLKDDTEDDGTSPNLDDKNPDKSKQSRRIVGLEIIFGLVYDSGSDKWDDGNIYNARNGKTYDSSIKYNDGKLTVKGCLFSWGGCKSQIWTKA